MNWEFFIIGVLLSFVGFIIGWIMCDRRYMVFEDENDYTEWENVIYNVKKFQSFSDFLIQCPNWKIDEKTGERYCAQENDKHEIAAD